MAIESFESFDEMWHYLQEQKEAADAQVQPWQYQVKALDFFRKQSNCDFPIYGVVLPEEERREQGLENYRFTKCYSVACPEGELGDIHVSTIEAILTEEEFRDAHQRGWQV